MNFKCKNCDGKVLNTSFYIGLILVMILVIIGSLASNASSSTINNSLQFIYVIMRHGSRAPVITYPNDPYPRDNIKFWPFGPESLTKVGRREMVILGKRLKEEYGSFLGDEYLPSRFTIRYNPRVRLFESGSCMAAGLFPPSANQIWDKHLAWLPVYMTVFPFEVSLLPDADGDCPVFAQESQKQINIMDEKSDEQKELLEEISRGTGLNVTKLSQIHYISSTLLYDVNNGFKLPMWAKNVYPDKIRPYYAAQLIAKFAGSSLQLKLGAGPILKNVSETITEVVKENTNSRSRMHVIVTHDNTIISLLRAMGNRNPYKEILLGAYIVYEVHQMPKIGHLVKIMYYEKFNTTSPEELELPDCQSPCSLDKFNKYVDQLNFPNWKEACNKLN